MVGFGGLITRSLAAMMPVLLCVQVFAYSPAHAQQTEQGDLNLVTSPLPVLLLAKPGTSVSTELKVKNGGNSNERLRVDLLKFAAFGEEGQPRLLDPEPGDEFFNWVTFSQKTFNAEPNEWKTIKMTINVPRNAGFGYYYAVTFSRAGKEVTDSDRKTTIRGATAVLVLLDTQNPNARKELNLVSFSSKRGLYEFLPSTFETRIHNPGNIHLSPIGNIFISQGKKHIGQVAFNPDKGNILPNSHRIFETDWNEGFPRRAPKIENDKVVTDKHNRPVMKMEWNLADIGKIRFGKYTATALVVYDNGKRDIPLEASVSFWVIPWRFLLVVTLILGLMLAGAWSIFGNFRRPFRKRRR